MKSTIKTIIAITAIAALAACGNKDEGSGPNIEMPAVGQPKPVAKAVIEAPQDEAPAQLPVPLEQFKVLTSEAELMAVEPGGNYVAVTGLIRAVNDPASYGSADTEYMIYDDLVSGYEPIFERTGWRLDFDDKAQAFNKVPGDLTRMADADKIRIHFMVRKVHQGPQIVEADVAAIEILDLDGKVIAKKSL